MTIVATSAPPVEGKLSTTIRRVLILAPPLIVARVRRFSTRDPT